MNWYTVLFALIAFVYIGLSLGVAVRFIEENKYYLIPLSLSIPIMVFIFDIKYCVNTFKRKKKIYNKFKYFFESLYIVSRYYNILIQFNTQVFVESKLNENIRRIFAPDYKLEPRFEKMYIFNKEFMKRELKIG